MDDNTIVNSIYDRNDSGLKALERKYGKRLLKICTAIAGKEDGEECLDDTYLSVWESIPPNRPENLFAYAAAIARRKAISRYRTVSALKRGANTDILLSELEECLPSDSSVERQYEQDELSGMINGWLGTLKPQERRMFVLRYFGGESAVGIANKLCVTPSSVRTTLSRLRGKLKEHLEKGGITL